MTLGQKVGQLLVAGMEGYTPGEDALSAIQTYQVGGIILFSRNVESAQQLAQLTNALKEANGDYVPLLLSIDQEGGRVSRMPPEVASLPAPLVFGQTGDATLVTRFGRVLGAECAAFGLNTDYAPSLDIWSNPENTAIVLLAHRPRQWLSWGPPPGRVWLTGAWSRWSSTSPATGTPRPTPTWDSPWWKNHWPS